MTASKLLIADGEKSFDTELNPKGVVIGRSSQCDLVLENGSISKKHARFFKDPFDRWIIEDLDSSNGTFVNGTIIKASAVLPGDTIIIGPYSLSIEAEDGQSVQISSHLDMTHISITDYNTEEIYIGREEPETILSGSFLQELNKIIEKLSELNNISNLYTEICGLLAVSPMQAALVLNIASSQTPNILACHFKDAKNIEQPVSNLYLSSRVLASVAKTGQGVMAQSIPGTDNNVVLTVVDEQNPRAVICVPLGDTGSSFDALYVDIPYEKDLQEKFEFIRAVAQQVVHTRKGLALMKMKEERSAIDYQLSMAQKIQTQLMPDIPDHIDGLDLAIYYKPAMWVGGDYFDLWQLTDDKLVFAVGDVSGKGLAAAMVMSNLQAALRMALSADSDLGESLKKVNSHMMQNLPDGLFVTLFLGVLEISTGTIEYINAGHLLPIVIKPDSGPELLKDDDNPVIGVMDTPFEAALLKIKANEGMVIFTDGITEAMSPQSEQYQDSGIIKLLENTKVSTAETVVDTIVKDVEAFRQSLPQQDDTTIFALFNRSS